jgi:hypothetical protein
MQPSLETTELAHAPGDYDPFSKEVVADPLPFYRRLRREAPVFYLVQIPLGSPCADRRASG